MEESNVQVYYTSLPRCLPLLNWSVLPYHEPLPLVSTWFLSSQLVSPFGAKRKPHGTNRVNKTRICYNL